MAFASRILRPAIDSISKGIETASDVALQPPRHIQQAQNMCWCAALESWLEVTVTREAMSQEELIYEFEEWIDANGLTPAGFLAISSYFNLKFATFDTTLPEAPDPSEFDYVFISSLLKRQKHIYLFYNLAPGIAHASIIYGVRMRNGSVLVRVMDPRGTTNVEAPLSTYQSKDVVIAAWAR